MSKSKLLHPVLAAALLCVASAVTAQNVTTTIVHDTFAASAVNTGLDLDANGYRAPSSTQAVWFGGGSTVTYTPNTSIGQSAGNRALLAYFVPSTTLANLAVGETLTATVTFKYAGGTGASSTGDFRMAFLNSNGNGTATNGIGSPPAGSRLIADNFSITAGGDTPRGYSGYVVDTTASPTPSTNSLSFWRRDGAAGKSQQWVGPTSGDLAPNTAFSQLLPGAGGGPAGAIMNDGTTYVATYSVQAVSATNMALSYTVTSGATTVMSFAVNETADAPLTGFDTFLIFTTYNAAISVTDFKVAKTSVAPTIATQPVAQVAAAGTDVTFTAAANGAPTPTYQWQKNGVDISGATSNTLSLTSVLPADAGAYRVIATNAVGSVTSTAATLTVLTSPEITTQPAGKSVFEGQNTTFTVVARGAPPLAYQWKKDGVDLNNGGGVSGATTASLALTSAQLGFAGAYSVVITNTYGSVTSNAAALAVYPSTPPSITSQPASQSVFEGATVQFSVGVGGPPPFIYVWKKNGVALVADSRITGVDTGTLQLGNVRLSDAGSYSVVVSNFAADVPSAAAALTVNAAPTPIAPTALLAGNIKETTFTAKWSGATNAIGYLLDVGNDAAFSSFVSGFQNLDVGPALSSNISGLTIDTNYYYRVRAYNSTGTSGNSNVVVVRVQTPVAPVITSVNTTTFTVGVPGAFTVTASGAPPPSFVASGLPSWASLNTLSGVLSGTPPSGTAGTQIAITITAQNDKAPNGTQIFTLVVQAVPSVAEPLTVTTLAGLAGTSGTTDATGTAARFKFLSGVALDGAGNAYVADTGSHTIRKVTAAGVVTTIAGKAGVPGSADGTGTAATFNMPTGIAADSAGNLYVADTLNQTIRKITTAGVVTTLAGTAGSTGSTDGVGSAARFFWPQGLALDAAATNLYVADTNNHTIRKVVLSSGTVSTAAGLAGQVGSADGFVGAARFNAPADVTIDKNGNLYVADTGNGTIRSISSAGVVTTLAGLAGSSGAADGAGGAARFNQPSAVVVDASFNIYVLDTYNHTVRKVVSAVGVVTTVGGQAGSIGSADGIGAVARFNYPTGLAIGAAGDLYIADTNNHTLRVGGVPSAPVILTQPQSQTALAGVTVQMTVKASGRPAPTYQWLLNGSQIAGATSDTLIINPQPATAGDYTVVVTNALGTVTSNRAGLVVNPITVSPVGLSGGGGGAPGIWFYLALASLIAARWAARRQSRASSDMMKSTFISLVFVVALLLPSLARAQVTYLVHDTFSDTDRIGGTDGSATSSTAPVINAATSTNTQWVVSRVNQMVASSSGLLWTQDTTSSTMAMGYFPTVTIGATPTTFTLKFTTGTLGATTNNLRLALVNGTPNGFRVTDGLSTGADAASVDDTGYGIFSASSNVGGSVTTDLVLRTYKRVTTTTNTLLSASGDWGTQLAASSGATGYLQPNTSYTLAITLTYDGSALTINTSLTGGNLVGMSYSITDTSSPTLTFNEIALRMGGGSAQFSSYNFTEFSVTTPAVNVPPSISVQPSPTSQTAPVGSNVSYTVVSGGTAPLSYQWQKKPSGGSFADISGKTTDTLALTNVQTTDAGDYQVVVTNGFGSATTNPVTLNILPPPPAPVANVATGYTASTITASWESASGATAYRLDVSTGNTFSTFVSGYQDLDVGSSLSRAVTGLTPGTAYYYRVRATNASGASISSNTVSASTASAVQTTAIVHDTISAATLHAGLVNDGNAFLTPTSTQAAWASFGTANIAYTQNLSLGVSAGTRGLMAYFEPSTALANLAVGETISASVSFKFTGGTGASTAGNFRVALLNSGGNGTASNLAGAARYLAGVSNSLTTGAPAPGYAGYILETTAATTASTNAMSYWLRSPTAAGSKQIIGPTGAALSTVTQPSDTFTAVGTSGGGTVGAIANDGATIYTAVLTVKNVSATQVDLAFTLKSGDTTIQSYALSQTSGTFVTSFDSLMLFWTFNATIGITDLNVTKLAPSSATAPTVTTPPLPSSQSVTAGANVTFNAVAGGTAPFTYQWQKRSVGGVFADIPSATGASLALSNAQVSDSGDYRVVITNAAGSITSSAATLTVTASVALSIAVQPLSQTALTGTRVGFSVRAGGTPPFTYQWKKGGAPINGATSQTLQLSGLQAADAADYTVTVTNSSGSLTSAAATLTLVAPAVALPTQPTIPAGAFNVVDYGALGDGATNNTTAIQAAINAAQTAGGGTIVIPAAVGSYLCGPITLRSNMNLQLDGGATLRALPFGTYPNSTTSPTDLITVASGASNVAITGTGTIEGDGSAWWTAYNNSTISNRPRLVQFTRDSNVLISGITLQNSPQFHIAMSGSGGTANNNVTIFGLTVIAPSTSPNTDGVDPTATNVLIQGCNISVGDDNIAIKAQNGVCGNITVADCTFGAGHGLSVGGQTNLGLDGLVVMRCTFTGTTSGLRLKADATQGGPVQNLSYSDLTMTNVPYPIVFYSYYNQVGTPGAVSGSSQTTPAKVNTYNATPPDSLAATTISTWKNITISNLTATGATGYNIIWGLPLANALIANVTLNNVSITGGPGLEIYNATNVQFTGTTSVGNLTTANSLAITGQPQSVNSTPGVPVTFTVTAAGASGVNSTGPTYQWKRGGIALVNGTQSDGSVVAGATTATLTLSYTRASASGDYTCTVSNLLDGYNVAGSTLAAGSLPVSATSSVATLSITGTGAPLTVTTQPVGQTVNAGDTVTFSVAASSTTPLAYQWLKGGSPLTNGGRVAGATTDTLTITGVLASDAGDFACAITNDAGLANSAPATLVVHTPPVIATQPVGQSIFEGASATFSVTASGTDPLSYQWKKNGSNLTNGGRISGATSSALTITGALIADSGSYTVTVTNVASTATSNAATFTVSPVPTAPVAPVANAATALTSSGFTASWNSTSNTTGYRLDVSPDNSFSSFVSGYQDLNVGTNLSRAVINLAATTNYFYRVRAVNDVGPSANSNTIAVTTAQVTIAPTFTSANGTIFTLGLPSTFTVRASGTPAPTFSATNLPVWVTLNGATGLLSGTPPSGISGAQFQIVITASNGTAPNASQAFTLTVLSAPAVTTPMTITTVAGLALTSGSVDGTGTAARFFNPLAVATDTAGNVYVADTDNHIIRRIAPGGVVTTIAGSAGISGSTDGSGGSARFNSPSALVLDSSGNIYVADTLNHTIRKITVSGAVSTLAGKAGTAGSADSLGSAARFFAPQGLAYTATGSIIYVADTNNHTIRKIDLLNSNAVTTLAGQAGQPGSTDGLGGAARFNGPTGLAVDQNGSLYVADTDNNAIRAVSSSGAVSTLAGLSGSIGAADGTGTAARFSQPSAVAVDSGYNVYVLDTDNHTIRKIVSAAGVVTTIAGQAGAIGSADGSGATARFKYPAGLAQASTGEFYIADTANQTLRQGVFPNAPLIQTHPQSQAVTSGATVQFFVVANGQPAPTYQWRFNGSAISGAIGTTLALANVQASNAGSYTVVVTNSQGAATSNAATLTVNAPPPSGGVPTGGGGGAPGFWFYFALVLLLAVRRTSLRRTAQTVCSPTES